MDKWVLTDRDGNEIPATTGVPLEFDPAPVIENGKETAHGVAVRLASLLRSVADAPLEPPLDPMTWRAAMLAAARIVEEDAAVREGRQA